MCFDSLHFTNTAFYRRFGRSCLGLDADTQKVSWWTNKDKQSKKSYRSDPDRYYGKGKLKLDSTEAIVPAAKDVYATKSAQSFISIASESTKEGVSSEADPLGVYDASTRQYIGDQPTGNSTIPNQPGVASFPNSKGSSVSSREVAEFNKYLHENPYDVHKWLEFVKFQDTSEAISAASVGDGETQKRKKTTLHRMEKKQSIMEKALKHNPDNIELLLAQLELCRESWSDAEQVKQWKKVLRSHPDNIALWQEYMMFNQATFSIFSVAKTVAQYEKCFEALQSTREYLDDGEERKLTEELMGKKMYDDVDTS